MRNLVGKRLTFDCYQATMIVIKGVPPGDHPYRYISHDQHVGKVTMDTRMDTERRRHGLTTGSVAYTHPVWSGLRVWPE